MLCRECGTENEDGAKTCKNCGKSLGVDIKKILVDGKETLMRVLSEKDGKTYFNPKKYLSYAIYYQIWAWIISFIIIVLSLIVSFAIGAESYDVLTTILVVIFGGLFGLFTAWVVTLILKIKVQDMRWKVDIHSALMNDDKKKK